MTALNGLVGCHSRYLMWNAHKHATGLAAVLPMHNCEISIPPDVHLHGGFQRHLQVMSVYIGALLGDYVITHSITTQQLLLPLLLW